MYGPLSREPSVASLRAVGGLCLKVFLEANKPGPCMSQMFAEQKQEVISDQNELV